MLPAQSMQTQKSSCYLHKASSHKILFGKVSGLRLPRRLDVDWRKILSFLREISHEVNWIELAVNMAQLLAIVMIMMNF